MLLAPIDIALANAINKRLLLIMRNGEIVDSGSCPGQSEKSLNRQDVVTNLSGKYQPSGVQSEDPIPRSRYIRIKFFFIFLFFPLPLN